MIGVIITVILFIGGAYFLLIALTQKQDSDTVSILPKAPAPTSKEKTKASMASINAAGSFNAAWLKLVPNIEVYYKKLLQRANLEITTAGLFFIKELLVVITFGVLGLLFNMPPTILFVCAIITFFLPDFFVISTVSKRQYKILRTLPEIVDLLGLCLSAGLDFTAALKWLTEGKFLFDSPFVDELHKIREEILLGKSKTQALKDMDQKLEISDVSSLVRTIIIAENMGVSVSDALERLSGDVRERRFHRGERQARMASITILVPLIFMILPVVAIIIIGPIFLKFTEQGFSNLGM